MDFLIKKVEVDAHSLHEVLHLMRLAFPSALKFSFDYLKWQYVQNPEGQVVGFNAYADDLLAAHYATMPVKMNIGGEIHRGLLSLNTATHPDYRGKRLFSILAERTYKYAEQNGYEFVVGVANANSTPGFLKNLKFELISSLVTKIGIGTNLFQTKPTCFRMWNKELMEWRLGNPSNQYACKDGRIFSKMDIFGVKAIMGYFPKEVTSNLDDRLVSQIHWRPLNLYIGLGSDLSKGVYCGIPSFIKKSPLNLIFRDLSGKLPKLSKEDFFFQLIDFDVL